MKKSAFILLTSLIFLSFSVIAVSDVCITQGQEYYCYWNHWLSDEGWGQEVSDYSNADRIYCNISAGMGAPEPWDAPDFFELRWFKPDGDSEQNIGICNNGFCLTKEFVHQGGGIVGWYSAMVIGDIYREPGQWRIEHWADGHKEGVGWGWHKLFTAYFTIPPRPFISVSPISFWSLHIIDSIACPVEDPDGITFDGTNLWVSDYWEEKIYKLDSSGNIISSIDSPGICPGDLTFDSTKLWNIDPCDEKIYQLDISGNITMIIDSPGPSPTGLTFNGTYLWVADSVDAKIYQLDISGNIISSFDPPGQSPSDLAFDGKYLWNVNSSVIYEFDITGNVIVLYDSPVPYPDGITFDRKNLLVIDDNKIYRIDTPDEISVGSTKTETYTITSVGSIELEVGDISITGYDKSEFSINNNACSGKSLSQNDTCTFDVVFSPAIVGSKKSNPRDTVQ